MNIISDTEINLLMMHRAVPAYPVSPDDGAGLGPADLPGHALALGRPGELGIHLGRQIFSGAVNVTWISQQDNHYPGR